MFFHKTKEPFKRIVSILLTLYIESRAQKGSLRSDTYEPSINYQR